MNPVPDINSPEFALFFWERVEKAAENECWNWKLSRNPRGYGQLWIRFSDGTRKFERSHRISFFLSHGPIPEGLHVLHSCDNPSCCNPCHLRAGTPEDNVRDMMAKGRGFVGTTKFSPEQVLQIRKERASGVLPRALAVKFQTSSGYIYAICKGVRWKNLAAPRLLI